MTASHDPDDRPRPSLPVPVPPPSPQQSDDCGASTTAAAATCPAIPTTSTRHHHHLLPPDHPIHAYLDDARALVELLADEPGGELLLEECRELDFLRRFVLSQQQKQEEGEIVAGAEAGGASSLSGGDEHDEGVSGDDDNDEHVDDARGDRQLTVLDDSRGTRSVDDDNEDEDEAGYWDDDDPSPDEYPWPPPAAAAVNPSPPIHDANESSVAVPTTTPAAAAANTDDENDLETYEVVVIGAGAAGLGVSVALLAGGLKRSNLLVLERNSVGSSFDSWHAATRFISPSWFSNPYGPVDLNSVDPFSSVAAFCASSTAGVCGSTSTSTAGGSESTNDADMDRSGVDGPMGSSSDSSGLDKKEDEWDDCMGGTQHPTGAQYAAYLRRVASQWKLPVRQNSNVASIRRMGGTEAWPAGGFEIEVDDGEIQHVNNDFVNADGRKEERRGPEESVSATVRRRRKIIIYSRFVIWCGGEWSYPECPRTNINPSTPGDEEEQASFEPRAFVHYAKLGSSENEWDNLARRANANPVPWNGLPVGGEMQGGDDTVGHAVVVGAYEAGVDTACALLNRGVQHVTLVDSEDHIQGWEIHPPRNANGGRAPTSGVDPSVALSPISAWRLRRAYRTGRLTLLASRTCVGCVAVNANGGNTTFCAKVACSRSSEAKGTSTETETLLSSVPIILCTGFDVAQASPIRAMVEWNDNGSPILSQSCDESVTTPGFFICGPMLRHWTKRDSAPCLKTGLGVVETCGQSPHTCNGDTLRTLSEEPNAERADQEIIFCFIYKFRTRFALVAGEIISRLIYEDHCSSPEQGRTGMMIDKMGNTRMERLEKMLAVYKERGMLLSHLDCSMSCASATDQKGHC